MVKWFNRNKNRPFHAQEGGHNVTPALAEYGIAKKFMEEGKEVNWGYTPPQPLRKTTFLDYILFTLGLAFFAAVLYFGVGYYYDTCNTYGTFEFGGVNYYGR